MAGSEGEQRAAAKAKIQSDKDQIASMKALQAARLGYLAGGETGIVRSHDIAVANEYSEKIRKLSSDMLQEQQTVAKLTSAIKAQGQGHLDVADKMSQEEKAATKSAEAKKKASEEAAKAEKEHAEAISKHIAEINKVIESDEKSAAAARKVDEAYDKAYTEASRSIDKFLAKKKEETDEMNGTATKDERFKARYDAETEEAARAYDEMLQKARQYDGDTRAIEASRDAYMAAAAKKLHDEQDAVLSQTEMVFKSVYSSMTNEVSSDVAKMITQHKNLHDVTLTLTRDMESQFISMVTKMALEWAMFDALTSGAFGATGIGSSAGANALLGTHFAATGFNGLVSSPTAFMAGEAGRTESVSIQPLGGGSSSTGAGGGGGGQQNIGVSVTVQAAGVVTDINTFANMIAQKAAYAVRGQGQIAAVRSS